MEDLTRGEVLKPLSTIQPNPDGKITRNTQVQPNSKDPVKNKERFKQLNYQN